MAKTKAPVAGQPGYDPTSRPQPNDVQEPQIERGIVEVRDRGSKDEGCKDKPEGYAEFRVVSCGEW
jgi:hypothetical protein